MIVKFKDLVFDNETLIKANKTKHSICWVGLDFKKACNSPKHLIIDWKDANPEDIDLSILDKDELSDYCFNREFINNKEVLGQFIKHTDRKDPETMWIMLVDNDRIISHDLYCKNTFDENLDILVKMTNFKLPL